MFEIYPEHYPLYQYIAAFFVISGILAAIFIGWDLIKNRQSMKIMNAVWIITGLWASYLGLWFYYSFGRENVRNKGMDMKGMDMKGMDMKGMDMKGMDMKDMDMGGRSHTKAQSIALSALHCGAGCTLADIVGLVGIGQLTFFVSLFANFYGSFLSFRPSILSIFGIWSVLYILALIIGVYFQFFAIREMSSMSWGKAIWKAFKADVLSLTSWQVGMYGFSALYLWVIDYHYTLPSTFYTSAFIMQIAMLCGFFCAYPMNALLIKWGIKKGM